MLVKGAPGALTNMGYPSKMHLKPKSHWVLFAQNLFSTFWKFAQSTAVVLPYSVENL